MGLYSGNKESEDNKVFISIYYYRNSYVVMLTL